MKSTTGAHYIALDHIRALAAFMVFTWHFTHDHQVHGYPVTYSFTPPPQLFPITLLDNGHTGVALFMTLSGYLFAKLLAGKSINYGAFLWNRALRLLPLLIFVILLLFVKSLFLHEDVNDLITKVYKGFIYPTMPNGGWSITTEFHYYLILPVFLYLLNKSRVLPLIIVFSAILLRLFFHHQNGEVQYLAYWTIIGRIDQFALGMIVFQFRAYFTKRHILALLAFVFLSTFYWCFDQSGEVTKSATEVSSAIAWVFIPTIEGICYSVMIVWYDSSFTHSSSSISKFIGRIGEYSYSIYLFHFFIVFVAAKFVNNHIMDISNFYIACIWSLLFYLMMFPIGYLSFKYIEAPFLKLRKPYLR